MKKCLRLFYENTSISSMRVIILQLFTEKTCSWSFMRRSSPALLWERLIQLFYVKNSSSEEAFCIYMRRSRAPLYEKSLRKNLIDVFVESLWNFIRGPHGLPIEHFQSHFVSLRVKLYVSCFTIELVGQKTLFSSQIIYQILLIKLMIIRIPGLFKRGPLVLIPFGSIRNVKGRMSSIEERWSSKIIIIIFLKSTS